MIQPSEAVIAEIAAQTDEITLAFSCGKDSIAAWLAVRPHFRKITPVYMYLIPGLEFMEQSLRYYEDYFQCHIMRVPHPSLYRLLRNFVFQAPRNLEIIAELNIPPIDYSDIIEAVRADQGLPSTTWHATGVRAVDSPIRMMSVRKYGAINRRTRAFWPVWDWNKARMVETLRQAKVRLPIDYKLFGRSFDGIDFRFLAPIKSNFPRDYERILEFFPMAEIEILRRQYYGQR